MNEITLIVSGQLQRRMVSQTQPQPGQTVGQAVEALKLTTSGAVLALVNGRIAAWDDVLQAGDQLRLIPAVGGGSQ